MAKFLVSVGIFILAYFSSNLIFDSNKYLPFADFCWQYGPQAERILNLESPNAQFQGPLYPTLLATLAFPLGGSRQDIDTAARIIAAMASIAFIWAVMSYFGWQVAVIMSLTAAFLTTTQLYSTDMVFMAFVMLTIWATKENRMSALVFVLCAILTRPIGIFMLPFVFLKHKSDPAKYGSIFFGMTIFLLVNIGSLSIWNHYYLADGGTGAIEAAFMRYANGDIPGISLLAWAKNIPETAFNILTGGIGLIGIVGAVGLLRDFEYRGTFFLIAVPALVLYSMAFWRTRFSLCFLPFIIYGVLCLLSQKLSKSQ